jgi:uncharacterized membrane protein
MPPIVRPLAWEKGTRRGGHPGSGGWSRGEMSTSHAHPRQVPAGSRPERRRHELARVLRRKRRLRAGLVQLLAAVAAVALGFLLPQAHIGYDIPVSEAVPMLVAVAAGTVTFIGVVYSLLFLVVQFASTTFTPRLNLFRDAPIVWRAFAFYVGVVVYSFTAALVIGRDEEVSGVVPFAAFLGMLISVSLYRTLQTAAFQSIQLAPILSQVVRRGRQVIDGLYTAPAPADPGTAYHPILATSPPGQGTHQIRWPHPAAVIQVINVPRVLRAAGRAGATVEFTVGSGEMIAEGAALALVSGPPEPALDREVLKALTVGEERTFEQDPALALRLLADIALRALSPAVNDPTTAVQALDRIESLLRILATRDLSMADIADSNGTTRVTLVLPTWDQYLAVALDEIIALPGVLPTISARLTRLLDDIAAIAPPDRRPGLGKRRAEIAPPA